MQIEIGRRRRVIAIWLSVSAADNMSIVCFVEIVALGAALTHTPLEVAAYQDSLVKPGVP